MLDRMKIAGMAALLLLLSAVGASAFDLLPSKAGKSVILVRGDSEKAYFSLAKSGLTIPLQGPGELSGWVKMTVPPGKETASGDLELSGVPGIPKSLDFKFKASDKDHIKDAADKVVSGGKKIGFSIPKGKHHLKIKGDARMMLILYYDGPEQPLPKERRQSAKRARAERKPSPWKFSGSFNLNLNYDDNIIHYSPDLIDEFADGPYMAWYISESEESELEFGKYRVRTVDDLIVTPTLDLTAQRKIISWGNTRLRAKFNYSRYLYNPIKDVRSLTLYFRQYLPGSGQSVEVSYRYTPEKYIRELTDTGPYEVVDGSRPWVGFRFASNDLSFNYRHRVHKKLFLTITLEDVHRFYNQPFLEQDLVENEIIGRGDYSLAKNWRLSLIYGTARGWTRRHDTVVESPLDSDDNDNSYTQDRYRFDLRWRPDKFFFDTINLRYQLRIAYFTSPKSLWDDPFHVGRKDVYDTLRLSLDREISKKIDGSLSFDYTKRTLHSPYTGDISEGMDYGNFQVWLDLTYNW